MFPQQCTPRNPASFPHQGNHLIQRLNHVSLGNTEERGRAVHAQTGLVKYHHNGFRKGLEQLQQPDCLEPNSFYRHVSEQGMVENRSLVLVGHGQSKTEWACHLNFYQLSLAALALDLVPKEAYPLTVFEVRCQNPRLNLPR